MLRVEQHSLCPSLMVNQQTISIPEMRLKPRKRPRRPPIWEMKSMAVIRRERWNWKMVGSWETDWPGSDYWLLRIWTNDTEKQLVLIHEKLFYNNSTFLVESYELMYPFYSFYLEEEMNHSNIFFISFVKVILLIAVQSYKRNFSSKMNFSVISIHFDKLGQKNFQLYNSLLYKPFCLSRKSVFNYVRIGNALKMICILNVGQNNSRTARKLICQ